MDWLDLLEVQGTLKSLTTLESEKWIIVLGSSQWNLLNDYSDILAFFFFFFWFCLLSKTLPKFNEGIVPARGFPGGSVVKNPPANAGYEGSTPGSGRSPAGGNDSSLQYSCLENPHGQRSLVGYSPRGHKESDKTEQLSISHTSSNL